MCPDIVLKFAFIRMFASEIRLKPCSACLVIYRSPTAIGRLGIIIIILKKVGSARLRESDIHPISPNTSAPQYQPINRKKRKGKRVEDCSRDKAA